MRANLMVFFMICGVLLVVDLSAARACSTARRLRWRCCSAFPSVLGMADRLALLPRRVDQLYRRVAYAIIALAAL